MAAPITAAVDGFEVTIWAVAQEHARSLGFEFEINCEHNFRQLARTAFARVQGTIGPETITNTRHLIVAMVAEAKAQGATTLHEWTLQGALAKLCPLYPFC